MKTLAVRFALAVVVTALAGCNSNNSANRENPNATPGEKVGQAAYKVQKGAEKAAKELQQDVKTFSHDAREGFKEEKQKDLERKKPADSEPAK